MTICHILLLHVLPLLLLHHSISRPRFCHAQVAYLVSLWGESLGLAMAAAPWGERLNEKASRCLIIPRWCDFYRFLLYTVSESRGQNGYFTGFTSKTCPAGSNCMRAFGGTKKHGRLAASPSISQYVWNCYIHFSAHKLEQPHPSPLWEAFDESQHDLDSGFLDGLQFTHYLFFASTPAKCDLGMQICDLSAMFVRLGWFFIFFSTLEIKSWPG